MSDVECVLIDFDGTFTRAEEEGAPFVTAYRADLAERLGRDLSAEWAEAEATVRARPSDHGWSFHGKLVAPANADPYIRSGTVARILMDRFGAYLDEDERDRALGDLYLAAYEHSGVVFKSDARETLLQLMSTSLPVYVVSNSATHVVARKIESLLAGTDARRPGVRGNARKAFIEDPDEPDEAFSALPERQELAGLARPVYLRRGRYYEVLRRIWSETGARPEHTLLVGDIYELDLAMPHHLGVRVHLIAGETTADYEKRFVASLPSGGVSESLSGVLPRLEERSRG
jgi:FMN phosphatase YigB (HAD superfamily)